MKDKVIAVDGFSASGKGSLCTSLSKILKLPYLNTGALYRAIGLRLKQSNFNDFDNIEKLLEIAKGIDFSKLNSPELFTEEIGSWASKVAKIQEIRNFLLDFQKEFCNRKDGAILDGRDIGTTICPDAKYKFFITASAEERAKRRYEEMIEKGIKSDYEIILQKIKERDYNDINRSNSPLKKADDAIEIDTTNMTKEEVLNRVLGIINTNK